MWREGKTKRGRRQYIETKTPLPETPDKTMRRIFDKENEQIQSGYRRPIKSHKEQRFSTERLRQIQAFDEAKEKKEKKRNFSLCPPKRDNSSTQQQAGTPCLAEVRRRLKNNSTLLDINQLALPYDFSQIKD
ncbi:hypothetical protein EUGRSUZ_E00829 [Eucalyptus grandis]|uniref:Uncharacterized protein n=2 Tax=Eucalyptus grandis TaxID=71139 RepID=A0ACC3KTP5_EUCGR|nr:hypothetical protein EUGRSUZ_E00829 [Eucalyptus grandis]